jgi:hypothetical protein
VPAPTTTLPIAQVLAYDPLSDPRVLTATTSEAAYERRAGGVIRAYRGILGRIPDQSGLTAWANGIAAGTATLDGMADATARSSEFVGKYGNLSNDAFTTRIYQNTFGRNPTKTEANAARSLFSKGKSRGAVANSIIGTTAGQTAGAARVQAVSSYEVVTATVPSTIQDAGWLATGSSLAVRLAKLAGFMS